MRIACARMRRASCRYTSYLAIRDRAVATRRCRIVAHGRAQAKRGWENAAGRTRDTRQGLTVVGGDIDPARVRAAEDPYGRLFFTTEWRKLIDRPEPALAAGVPVMVNH